MRLITEPTELSNHGEAVVSMLELIVAGLTKETPDPKIIYDGSAPGVSLEVNPNDQGRMVGKNGIIVWAVSTILWHAGATLMDTPIAYTLLEPTGRKTGSPMPFKPDPDFDMGPMIEMVNWIMALCIQPHGWESDMQKTGEVSATLSITIHNSSAAPSYRAPNIAEAISLVVKASGLSRGFHVTQETIWA